MKSDYKVVLSALLALVLIAGVWMLVDTVKINNTQDDISQEEKDVLSHSDEMDVSLLCPQVFNPNTTPDVILRDIGFSDAQVQTIIDYRNKGGVFSSPKDFARCLHLSQEAYERLLPYIEISHD